MVERNRTFLACPDCGKRGVTLRVEGTYWTCRYCPFTVQRVSPLSSEISKRARLVAANRDDRS